MTTVIKVKLKSARATVLLSRLSELVISVTFVKA